MSNEISIYDVIGWGDATPEFVRDRMKAADKTQPLTVRIASEGGSAFAGFAMFNLLKEHAAGVNVHIDGLAASAASVIAMAGTRIIMGPMSFLMIHEAWGGEVGNKRSIRKYAELLENVDKAAIAQYAQRSAQSIQQVTEWLEAETWFSAEEALAAGLANEIASEQKAMAFVEKGRWQYQHTPANLLVDSSIALQHRKTALGPDPAEAAKELKKIDAKYYDAVDRLLRQKMAG